MNIFDIKIKIYKTLEQVFGKNKIKQISLIFYAVSIKKIGILFIHIPKSAGTTISTELYGKRIGHNYYTDWKSLKGKKFTENMKSFSVVRNPITRLESAYRFAINGSDMGAVKNKKLYQADDRFRSFDSFVNEWLVKQDLNTCDILFRPQFLFVCDKSRKILVDKIFKIEEPKSIEQFLSKELNREVKLFKLNATSKKENKEIKYSEETINTIKKLYKTDYELFKYN